MVYILLIPNVILYKLVRSSINFSLVVAAGLPANVLQRENILNLVGQKYTIWADTKQLPRTLYRNVHPQKLRLLSKIGSVVMVPV